MFDFLQNLTKSAEEKRQELVAAYLDGALRGRSRQQFEQAMAQDEALRQEVEQLRLIKQSLRQLPQREVPRNFILDPAAFSRRPDPQPWVQAYPVLRAATALAAFFFIFALAAGVFTGFGGAAAPAMAPAADVAQVEEVEVTAESLAFEAEADDQAEVAEEDTAETAEEAEVELFEAAEEEMSDETMADEGAVEEVEVEESAAEEPAAEEAPPAESVLAATPQVDAAADEAVPAPQETAAAAATFTPTPPPTPTVSTLPRVTPPTPLPERDLEIAEGAGETSNGVAAGDIPAPAADGDTESAETTAVLPEEAVREDGIARPVSPLLWLQIGLGALLLLLVGLTIYARRQR